MNKMLAGPNFDSSEKYAINLNAVFIALFYFTALPVLLPIVMLSLLTNYLVEKYMIIKYYSKSNYLGEKID